MKTINRIINIGYCVGGSIVILGAWSKLLHKPFANTMLTIGLLTEALLFLCMSVQEFSPAAEQKQAQGSAADNSELTTTLKATNSILTKIFNTRG